MQLTDDKGLSIHRLVQSTRLEKMTDGERNSAFNMTIELLTHHFPRQVLGNHMHDLWSDCELFLPHVLAFENAVRQWNPSLEDNAAYINMMCDCTW